MRNNYSYIFRSLGRLRSIYSNETDLNASVRTRVKWTGWFRKAEKPNVDGVFGYVLSKRFPPKKSTMFRDLYGVNSERSCVNASVSYRREFPYVTSALSNGKQRRRGIVLRGSASGHVFAINSDAAHKCLFKSFARKHGKLIRSC